MTSEDIHIIATFTPIPGREAAVLDVLRTVETASRSEPGSERYTLYASTQEARTRFHIIETYRDDTALQAHRNSEHYRRYRNDIAELLAAPIDVAILQDPDSVVSHGG